VRAPEHISSVSRDEFVEAILGNGLTEWWVAGHHNEKNDTNSEEVD